MKSRIVPKFNEIKFLSRIRKVDSNNCWIWGLSLDRDGYGSFYIGNDRYRAHRVSYSLFIGNLSPDLVIDHICRNRSCVNPDHLREVDVRVNSTENSISFVAINKIKTHCVNGHEFNVNNTYFRGRKNGGRICKTCVKERAKKRDRVKYNSQQRLSYHARKGQ